MSKIKKLYLPLLVSVAMNIGNVYASASADAITAAEIDAQQLKLLTSQAQETGHPTYIWMNDGDREDFKQLAAGSKQSDDKPSEQLVVLNAWLTKRQAYYLNKNELDQFVNQIRGKMNPSLLWMGDHDYAELNKLFITHGQIAGISDDKPAEQLAAVKKWVHEYSAKYVQVELASITNAVSQKTGDYMWMNEQDRAAFARMLEPNPLDRLSAVRTWIGQRQIVANIANAVRTQKPASWMSGSDYDYTWMNEQCRKDFDQLFAIHGLIAGISYDNPGEQLTAVSAWLKQRRASHDEAQKKE